MKTITMKFRLLKFTALSVLLFLFVGGVNANSYLSNRLMGDVYHVHITEQGYISPEIEIVSSSYYDAKDSKVNRASTTKHGKYDQCIRTHNWVEKTTYSDKKTIYYYRFDDESLKTLEVKTGTDRSLSTNAFNNLNSVGKYSLTREDRLTKKFKKTGSSQETCAPIFITYPKGEISEETTTVLKDSRTFSGESIFYLNVIPRLDSAGKISTSHNSFIVGSSDLIPTITGTQVELYEHELIDNFHETIGSWKIIVAYQWQMKDANNNEWINIHGRTEKDLGEVISSQTNFKTSYRRLSYLAIQNIADPGIVKQIGNFNESEEIDIFSIQPVAASALKTINFKNSVEGENCYGEKITLNSTPENRYDNGGTGDYLYKWEYRKPGDPASNPDSWVEFAETTEPNVDIYGHQGTGYYRKKVISDVFEDVSNALYLEFTPVFEQDELIPVEQYVCGGTPEKLVSAYSLGSGDGDVIWEKSKDQITWDQFSVGDYELDPAKEAGTVYYRRKITDNACEDTDITNVVSVVYFPAVNAGIIGSSQGIEVDEVPQEFVVIDSAYGGDSVLLYQWQKRELGTNDWIDIVDGNTQTYQSGAINTETSFRRQVKTNTDKCPVAVSNSITITTDPSLHGGFITINSSNTGSYYCDVDGVHQIRGATASGGIAGYDYEYFWEYSDYMDYATGDGTWDSIPGANGQHFDPKEFLLGVVDGVGNHYFRRGVTKHTYGPEYSNPVAVYMSAPLDGGDIMLLGTMYETKENLCYSTIPTSIYGFNSTGGIGDEFFYWERSFDSINWSQINHNRKDYTLDGELTTDLYIRRVTHSKACGTQLSNVVSYKVADPLEPGKIIFENQRVCFGDTDTIKEFEESSGGLENYTYQWEISETGSNWEIVPFEQEKQLLMQDNEESVFVRRKTIDQECGSIVSNTVKLNVLDEMLPVTINKKDFYCNGDNARVSVLPEHQFKPLWYSEERNLHPQNTFSLTVPNLSQDTIMFFQFEHVDFGCKSPIQLIELDVEVVTVDFEVEITEIERGDVIQFTNKSSSNAKEFYWNFFDGDGSLVENPWHYYNDEGFFPVELTVISENGCEGKKGMKNSPIIKVGDPYIAASKTQGFSDTNEELDHLISVYKYDDSLDSIADPTSIFVVEQSGEQVVFYPNPVNDVLNIESSFIPESVEVLSITGQTLLINFNTDMIDMSALPNGTYIVKAVIGNQVITTKIFK